MSKLILLMSLAYRNVWRNKRRTLLTLGAIVIGTWAALALSLLARGMSEQLAKDSIKNFVGHIQLHDKNYVDDPVIEHSFRLEEREFEQLSTISHVAAAAKRVRVPVVLLSERETVGATLIGIEPAVEREKTFLGESVIDGEMIAATDEHGILIGKKQLELLRTDIGKRIVVMGQGRGGEVVDRGFRIVGTFDTELEGNETRFVFTSFATAKELFQMNDEISEVSLTLDSREAVPQVSEVLSEKFPKLAVSSWTELEPLADTVLKVQDKIIIFWFFIVVIAVASGLINTLLMVVYERTREIGLFLAIGMKPGTIVMQVVFEATMLLVMGMLLGNAIALGTKHYFSSGLDLSQFASGTEILGISSLVYPKILLRDWLWGNGMIFILGIVSSFYPAWKASRLVPVDAVTRG